ncbi:hypothetical protein CPB97_007754 [Podila verticillata]|nr:hypothetical protein CPB97_007754 [Podila verticillata]
MAMTAIITTQYWSITKAVLSREQAEGVGARVRRGIGRPELHNRDPFLILDTFNVDKNGTDTIKVRTKDKEAYFVVIPGEPPHEPIVQHGPFVLNTKEEICSTVRNYHVGKNGFERAAHWQSRIDLK